jgi:hypothetical protein
MDCVGAIWTIVFARDYKICHFLSIDRSDGRLFTSVAQEKIVSIRNDVAKLGQSHFIFILKRHFTLTCTNFGKYCTSKFISYFLLRFLIVY